MLTLYYVSATFLQSWRINKIYKKINEQLAQKSTITFYGLPPKTSDGFDVLLATSDLCTNRNSAKVSEILWLHNNHRGCCLQPFQILPITSWITFPEAPSLQPFAYEKTSDFILKNLEKNRKQLLHILLETEIQQSLLNDPNQDIIKIEQYGKLIAWKVDSHLAVIIEMNVEYFTKFLVNTFLQNNYLINDRLTLLRIESVNDEGRPQPFAMVSDHLKKPTRTTEKVEPDEWMKHLDYLKSLCVLANQATEYVHSKSRAESAVIKPDLIPQEQRANKIDSAIGINKCTVETKTEETEGKRKTLEDHIEKRVDRPSTSVVNGVNEMSTKNGIENINDKKDNVCKKHEEAINFDDALKARPMTSTTSINEQDLGGGDKTMTVEPTKIITKVISSKDKCTNDRTPTISPSKIKTKPTNVKRHGGGILDVHLFKSHKNAESSMQSSELEKIAALKVCKSKLQRSSCDKEGDAILTTPQPKSKQNFNSELECDMPKLKSPNDKPEEKLILEQEVTNDDTRQTESLLSQSAIKMEISPIKVSKPLESTVENYLKAIQSENNTMTTNANEIGPPLEDILTNTKLKESKPPNVLIYAESASSRESAKTALKNILAENTYTIYNLTPDIVHGKTWADTTALLVVCGTVPLSIGEVIVDYFLHGGKVLSLCSDILHFILPTYRTAEVREHELVQFSYDRWHKIKMMHHIFCYQPSPVRKNFSTESDDGTSASAMSKKPPIVCLPRSIELMDMQGDTHQLDVKVLGTEETWNTPSLLLAQNMKNGGIAVFSQVHLEIHPSEFEADEKKYPILKQNESARYEIFTNILQCQLGLNVKSSGSFDTSSASIIFQNAYFLGRYEEKSLLLEKLKEKLDKNHLIQTPNITLKFCGPGEALPQPNNDMLPILIHSCPEDFSTVEYFENLTTKYIGRLVIYAPVLSSSQYVVRDLNLTNGLVVIARHQTNGIGRDKNQWLSPPGCVMFSLQLHISMDTLLGKRLSLIQHIIAAAVVNALREHCDYKYLDINLKWPNDIYAYGVNKIGGLCLQTFLTSDINSMAIVSAGCGINLDNSQPTVCINDMIRDYNNSNKQQQMPILKYELLLALIFNEIERLLEIVKSGDFDGFYKLYYSLWLHSDQKVTICDKDGIKREAQIIGIDENGYLQVKLSNGMIETVFPDGNSFDMLKGLIIPKVY